MTPGPPPLRPFGLLLHRDGSWSHEGVLVSHPKLRAAFDRGVSYLPNESKYVVSLGHFRGQIDVEEAAFFVRDFDSRSGVIGLSDRSQEALCVASLRYSKQDGALLCRVKFDLLPGGLLARFSQHAQAELFQAVTVAEGGLGLTTEVGFAALPAALQGPASPD